MHPQPWTSPLCSSWLRSGLVEKILLSHPRQTLSENIWRCESFTIEWPITVHFSLRNPGNASWITTKTAARGAALLPRGINILLLSVCIHLGMKLFFKPSIFFRAMRTRFCPDGAIFFIGAVDGLLTHGWSLVAAPRPTLGSEQGDLSLQHFHPGDQVLDGGCRRTTACSLRDVDAVGERHLESQEEIFSLSWGTNQNEALLKRIPTWLSASSVCSVNSVGSERSAGPSIRGLDPNPAREPFQNQNASAFLLLYCFAFEVKDQWNWPSVRPGDAAESSSTEQRDSKGTLMLYTWLNTRGCSLAVWFSEDKGGAWPPADVCLLTLVVRTSLLSADGAAGEEPWSDGETGKTFSKKQNTAPIWDSGGFLSVFVLWILGCRKEGMNTNYRDG